MRAARLIAVRNDSNRQRDKNQGCGDELDPGPLRGDDKILPAIFVNLHARKMDRKMGRSVANPIRFSHGDMNIPNETVRSPVGDDLKGRAARLGVSAKLQTGLKQCRSASRRRGSGPIGKPWKSGSPNVQRQDRTSHSNIGEVIASRLPAYFSSRDDRKPRGNECCHQDHLSKPVAAQIVGSSIRWTIVSRGEQSMAK
jgi:hypothetical protein